MIKPKTPACDGCGRTKEETNHWFVVSTRESHKLAISILTEKDTEDSSERDHHYCGEGCLIQAMPAELERLK